MGTCTCLREHSRRVTTSMDESLPTVTGLIWKDTSNHCGWTLDRPSHVGSAFVEATTPGKQVLEVGCAFGNVALPALRTGATVWVVDPCESHIEAVKEGA